MLALLLTLTGCFQSRDTLAAPAVTIVHTVRQEGELEPCG